LKKTSFEHVEIKCWIMHKIIMIMNNYYLGFDVEEDEVEEKDFLH